jgi:hypothetical protein
MLFMLFLFGSIYFKNDTGYEELKDLSWSHCHNSSFSIIDKGNVYFTNYIYCSQDLEISPDFIDYNVERISEMAFDYMNKRDLNLTQCKNVTVLEIYNIAYNILNNHTIFNGWQDANPQYKEIAALYDSRSTEKGPVSLILTNQGNANQIYFAHEMGHYWYDRFCLGGQVNYDKEAFAYDFERYYTINK